MANLLNDASQWKGSFSDATPPTWWDGTHYTYLGMGQGGQGGAYYGGAIMDYMDDIHDGDVVAGTITSTSPDDTSFAVLVNDAQVDSATLTNGTPHTFSVPLSAGDSVQVSVGAGDYLYSQDAVLVAAAAPVMPVASNETITCQQGSTNNSVTPVITQGGSPVTPDALTITSQPSHGSASVSGAALLYTPRIGFFGADSFTYSASVGSLSSNTATVLVTVLEKQQRNCDCDDGNTHRTLAVLRADLMRRLGFGAQVDNMPPGMADLLNSFLMEAQELLYRRYDVLRTERFYSWQLQEGVRFYDVDANGEACPRKLDPRKITWVGVERDGRWYPLQCGIPPELYTFDQANRWPQRYEIRQCIEVWPIPGDSAGTLWVKGRFELEAFASDADKTTIDDRAVLLLALANAKAHYGKPDASNYIQELEAYLQTLVCGAHQTRRYIPGRDARLDPVYVQPRPLVPFS